mgnify:CR=1 FL=1
MVSKWKHREESKLVSKAVVAEKSTEQLVESRTFIKDLLDLRKAQKLEKTYIKGTFAATQYNEKDKVYVDYRFDGTATGRLSCAAYHAKEPMGVSFHTLPRETTNNIRSIFVAPEGNTFVTVDYSTMELRVLAHLSRDKNMIKAFHSGEDLHSYTGSLLFNKDITEVSKSERQLAKTVSFLIVYGGGAFNLSETMGISIRKAERVVTSYKEVYPEVFGFMDYIHNFIRSNGYTYTIFGRRRNLQDITSSDKSVQHRSLRQGFNFIVQSTSSDILLFSLLGISERFKDRDMESRVVSTVHDSIELVCPHDELSDALKIVREEMVDCHKIKQTFDIDFTIPFEIEVLVGKSFGEGIVETFNG